MFLGLGNLLLVPRPTRVVLMAKDSRTWRVDLKAKTPDLGELIPGLGELFSGLG